MSRRSPAFFIEKFLIKDGEGGQINFILSRFCFWYSPRWMRTLGSDTIAGFASVSVAKPLRVEKVHIAKQWECAIPSPLPSVFAPSRLVKSGGAMHFLYTFSFVFLYDAL